MNRFPLHTGLAIAALALLLAAARLVAPVIQGPGSAQFKAIVDFAPERVPLSPLSRHPEPASIAPVPRGKTPAASPLLVDASGALDHFFRALWRTEKREPAAVTRIVHYGDSPTTAD